MVFWVVCSPRLLVCSLGCVMVWYHFLGLLSVSRLGPGVSFSAGALSVFFVASTLVVDDIGQLRRCRSQRFNFLVSIRTLDDIFDFLSTFPVDNCTSPKLVRNSSQVIVLELNPARTFPTAVAKNVDHLLSLPSRVNLQQKSPRCCFVKTVCSLDTDRRSNSPQSARVLF